MLGLGSALLRREFKFTLKVQSTKHKVQKPKPRPKAQDQSLIMLTMQNITKSFPGVRALDGVNFDLRPAEIHALVGENGAGKSTLMKILGGVYPHSEHGGDVFIDGKRQQFTSVRDAEKG